MITFEVGFERWHDFFLLAGTAGATLLGLLFVSVSLKTDVIMRSNESHLRAQAMSAFESLMFVMVLSLLLLMPVSAARLGPAIIAVGAIGLFRAVRHVTSAGQGVSSATLLLRRRMLLPVLAYLFIGWSGVEAIRKVPSEHFQLLAATLWLLVTATRGAWQLLVEVSEAK